MRLALVGYTGFVGSNICASAHFDGLYHSKNICESWGTKPDLLVYAGVRAEKYLANQNPDMDMAHIESAFENIDRIRPSRLVLISTIDVLPNPVGVDETVSPDIEVLRQNGQAYGANRLVLETRVRDSFPNALIVRLPALFGQNIKKNFIYDLIHRIPFMLKSDKMSELCRLEPRIEQSYELQSNGFFQLRSINGPQRDALRQRFLKIGFDALHFTDSRSVFQFYPLSRLWQDIRLATDLGIRLLHTATEPVSAAEIYESVTGHRFVNEIRPTPARYDYRSLHAESFGGACGYFCDKQCILGGIRHFVESVRATS